MSFISILKTIGKDLSHVAPWIEEGLKVAEPVIGAVDPSLGSIITEVETILGNLMKVTGGSITLTPAVVQSVVTAVSMLQGIKVGAQQKAGNSQSPAPSIVNVVTPPTP